MPVHREFKITGAKGGAAFAVQVVTRADSSELVGIQEDGTLKVRLVASPAGDPAANEELITLLSEKLGVAKNKIEIVAGATKRDKLISVEGITAAQVEELFGNGG